ncbi:Coiled-coil domain-containing protein 63 [Rhizophlyctis rosea]|uniref:Coiled-coil domain-containing protein 63 n=1 Tax=Rhizophlyctis rosea TaxID=64517 RepID=A0AAD5SKT5_9FUNG|nr:Coiled-coil domain-containing protein 63 [Rhizophlyctis rosea]
MALNRSSSLSSEQEINDGMAEIELQKLQRQYRIMEGDRKAYSEESRINIAKQRATIDKLKRDNQHLQDELKLLEVRNEDKRRMGSQSKQAEQMAEQAETYTRKIRQILSEIVELDDAIALMDRDIDQQRAELGGVNAASQNSEAIRKQIRILENRLDKALVKFNKSLAVNKHLRATIDNLRRERLVFDNIYRKFEKELMEQKKQMAEIIETSNSAYEARDEAQTRILALREKAEKEYQAYVQEMKELDRTLEQDRKLKDFMATKASDRHVHHESSTGEGGAIMPKKKGGKEKDSARFGSQELLTDSLETYETAFEEIRKVTGISDINELVKRFKAVEDQNFSLFNYVNEINNDIEKLAEEIVEVQRKIDGMVVEGVKEEEKRRVVVGDLEEQLNTSNEKADQYERRHTDMTHLISELRENIDHLVTKFQTANPQTVHQAPAVAVPISGTTALPPSAIPGVAPLPDLIEEADETPHIPHAITATDAVSTDVAQQSAEGFVQKVTDNVLSTGAAPFTTDITAPTDPTMPLPIPPAHDPLAPSNPSQTVPQHTTPVTHSTPQHAAIPALPTHSVTDTNLLHYLGLVEHKANDLLTLYYLVNAPRKGVSAAAAGTAAEEGTTGKDGGGGIAGASVTALGGLGGLLGQGPAPPVEGMRIVAPSTGDEHDEDEITEDDDRPLTREELEQRTLRGLSRREKVSNATKGGHKRNVKRSGRGE